MSINTMLNCHDRCKKYKAEVNGYLKNIGIGAYLQGFKRCTICSQFLRDEGIVNNKCLCCKSKITFRPKNKQTRLKLKEGLVI